MIFFYVLLTATSAPAATAPKLKTETLWKEWYLVTQKGAAISFFEETVEHRHAEHEVAITQKWVERMGTRSETYIGSVSSDTALEPVAFFVERKSATSYKTDARAKGNRLEITFKPGNPDLAKSTEFAPLEKSTFLSSFVPMAIAKRFSEKSVFPFTAVVEDGGNMNVEVKKGSAEIRSAEKKMGQESCRQASIKFDGKSQEWWITKRGKVCLVEFPESGVRMELSTEARARKALGEK